MSDQISCGAVPLLSGQPHTHPTNIDPRGTMTTADPTTTTVLIPADDWFRNLLRISCDLLWTLTMCRAEPDSDPWQLPAPFDADRADSAADRIAEALSARAISAGPEIYAPDGRYQHTPIRAVTLDRSDLATLTEAWRVCARAISPDADPSALDLSELLDGLTLSDAVSVSGAQAVDQLGRLVRLLTTKDEDTRVLLDLVTGQSDDVTLTDEQEAAYRRAADRWTETISSGDHLHRYVF